MKLKELISILDDTNIFEIFEDEIYITHDLSLNDLKKSKYLNATVDKVISEYVDDITSKIYIYIYVHL